MSVKTSIGCTLALAGLLVGSAALADATFYEHDDYRGRSVNADESIENFGAIGFNDRVSSISIRRGTWQVCTDANFRGTCVTLRPADYPSVQRFGINDRISSAREIGSGRPGRDRNARAILYEGRDLHGRSLVIDDAVMNNLSSTNFNDRASSLRVEGGYWVFCSDANFNGVCRTFGPGEYPTLPGELNNRISSGRRVYASYPYDQGPDWRR